jgi:hypothetical protein
MLRDLLQMVSRAAQAGTLRTVSNADWVTLEAHGDWQAVYIHHLTPDENRGKHNIFVDLLDEAGKPLTATAMRLGYTWEGRRSDELAPAPALDKQPTEPLGNLPIEKKQRISCWLEENGRRVSDVVRGLHTELPDQGTGNTWGHHSYYVIFWKRSAAVVVDPQTPVVIEPAPTTTDPKAALLRQIETLLRQVEMLLRQVDRLMAEVNS